MNCIDNQQMYAHPIKNAGFISKMSFWWLWNLFRDGMKRPLTDNDMIYDNPEDFKSERINLEFKKLWDAEKEKCNPHIRNVILKAYGNSVIVWGFVYAVLQVVISITQPLMLGGMVSYFVAEQTQHTLSDAYFLATGIVVTTFVKALSLHPFILYALSVGLKVRTGVTSLLYEKSLSLTKASAIENVPARLLNLISSDVTKFGMALKSANDLWRGPLEFAVLGYFIYREIGFSVFYGLVFIGMLVFIQEKIGQRIPYYRKKTNTSYDERVQKVTEIVQGIQGIKMYTWEKIFETLVDKIRKAEIRGIRGIMYVHASLKASETISKIAFTASIIAFIVSGNFITARKIFIVTSYYKQINDSMVFFFPLANTLRREADEAATRCNKFLLENIEKMWTEPCPKDKKERNKDKTKVNKKIDIEATKTLLESARCTFPKYSLEATSCRILMQNVTAEWKMKNMGGIFSINMDVRSPSVCAIFGGVGMGKSSLLNVILGELPMDEGECLVNGRISYCSQEPWLFGESVFRNIVFIEDYDKERYDHVVKICALETDFSQFPKGDATIVGEKGICLSGGQKARVNLARALYKQADIYLLDDPFSAVDTKVGKHIFEMVVKEFLKDKICILVTHQQKYLTAVDHVFVLNGGRLETEGTFSELNNMHLIKQIEEENQRKISADEKTPVIISKSTQENIMDVRQGQQKEKHAVGKVNLNVYKTYFDSVGNYLFVITVFLIFVASFVLRACVDYYLSYWSNWEEEQANLKINTLMLINSNNTHLINASNLNEMITVEFADRTRACFMLTFFILEATSVLFFVSHSFAFFTLCMQASINLHDKLLRGVTRAKMHFFNTNPSGRILNRFSADIQSIDTSIPLAMADVIRFILQVLVTTIIVVYVNICLILPTFIIALLFYYLRVFYINTGRSINRIEAIMRGQISAHTTSTLQGLQTIRALGAEERLTAEFNMLQNSHISVSHLNITTQRAFALYLDVFCCLYIAMVTYSFLLFDMSSFTGGSTGLAILYCINLSFGFSFSIRRLADLENNMVSVERVLEYANLPAEHSLDCKVPLKAPLNLTEKGSINVADLSLRYVENGPKALDNVTFHIKSSEKIGIVGRTGAGKSSMVQALFHLAINEGTIRIDNIDTKTLGLHDLRARILIIPQDPVLFSETLRFNLDPFNDFTDCELWTALEGVQLKDKVSGFQNQLQYKLRDGGSNFSMGERQLLCLARATLSSNKILILDEATANVDDETDNFIQSTIREKFSECTVLTIAHRLQTVMNSDRIMVIDNAKVVEFGHAYELLQKQGFLTNLVNHMGTTTLENLTEIARESFEKKYKPI